MTDAQQIAEIQRLGREVSRLAARVEALEKQGTVVQSLSRLIDGVNQYGSLQASLLQNQTVSNEPARPWRPV